MVSPQDSSYWRRYGRIRSGGKEVGHGCGTLPTISRTRGVRFDTAPPTETLLLPVEGRCRNFMLTSVGHHSLEALGENPEGVLPV